MSKKKSRFRSAGDTQSAMMQRTEESARNTSGSNKWRDYLVDDFTGTKWKVSEEEHLIDIIPYLCGDQDPRFDPGTPTYFLDLWVHQRLGITEDAFVCPASNFKGRPCPICEHLLKMRASGNFTDDELRDLTPKRRVLYNIICYDTPKEEDKGIQVWEASYHLTENELVELARNRRGKGYVPFADPDVGKSISFIRKGKGPGTRYKGYTLEDRPEPISEDILDSAYTLDELIVVPTYEELAEVFAPVAPEIEPGHDMGDDVPFGMGKESEEEEEEEKPKARRSRTRTKTKAKEQEPKEPEEEPEEEEPEEEEPEEEPTSKRRLGTTRRRR
jgi:hypothetical protein